MRIRRAGTQNDRLIRRSRQFGVGAQAGTVPQRRGTGRFHARKERASPPCWVLYPVPVPGSSGATLENRALLGLDDCPFVPTFRPMKTSTAPLIAPLLITIPEMARRLGISEREG